MEASPILLLVFNRPAETRQLFESIKRIAPPKLYIVADGPRPEVEGEEALCAEVKRIFREVDWDCKVTTLFRDTNIGCDPSIINGINWFFEQEEQGIIFEDDCIPAASFYSFCNQLLEEHKNNPEIAMISGTTYYDHPISEKYDYFISDFFFTWGWATWRHVWMSTDWNKRYDLREVRNKLMEIYQHNKQYVDIVYSNVEYAYSLPFPHWDNIFYINQLFQHKKCLIPSLNQVNNIGITGTHFKNATSNLFNSRIFEMKLGKDFSKKYRYLSEKEKRKLIKNYLKKYYTHTFRDRLYLFRMSIRKWLGFAG